MIEIVKDLDAFRKLQSGWDRLADRFGTPLLQHRWFLACAETLHADDRLHTLVVREDGRITAIAPLIHVRRRWVSWLEIIGMRRLHEPAGFLFESDSSLRTLALGLFRLRWPWSFQRIPTSSPVIDLLRPGFSKWGLTLHRGGSASLYLDTSPSWDAFMPTIAASRRTDLRRRLRRAEQLGKISFRVHCPDENTFESALQTAIEIESDSWKGRVGSSLKTDRALQSFFRDYLDGARSAGTLRICIMKLGGEPVAMQLAVVSAKRLWILKVGYREAFARYAPGMQLTMETIRHCFEQRLAGYEFLGVEEDWQRAWPVSKRDYSGITHLPWSFQGIRGVSELGLSVLGKRRRAKTRAAQHSERAKPATPERAPKQILSRWRKGA